MGYLTCENNRRIYFEDYGSGETAAVLVHGWGMGLRMWDYTVGALTQAGYRVVLLDHRGCGKSDKDFDDMGIAAITADLLALIDHLGLRRVVLNGWSLGGAVVVDAAAQLADRCAALVLTCGASPCYLQKDGFPYGGTEEALAETLSAMAADRVNFLAGLSAGVCASEVSQSIVDWMWASFMESSPLAAQSLADLGPLDQRDTLTGLTMPILSYVGAQDAVVDPAVCRSVKNYNNSVTLVECKSSGHAPFVEETAFYNQSLLDFLQQHL